MDLELLSPTQNADNRPPLPSPLKEAKENGYFPYTADEMVTLQNELLAEIEARARKPIEEPARAAIREFLEETFSTWTAMSSHDRQRGAFQNIPDLNSLLYDITRVVSLVHPSSRINLKRAFAQTSPKHLVVMQGMSTYRSRFMDDLPEDTRPINGDPITVEFIHLISPFANKVGVLSEPEMRRLQTDVFPQLIQKLEPCVRNYWTNRAPLAQLDTEVKRLPYAYNKARQNHFLPWLKEQLSEWADGNCGHLICERVLEILESTVEFPT